MSGVAALDDGVGIWPAGSVLVRSSAVPLSSWLGRRLVENVPLVLGRSPAIPFGAGAVGIHSGAQALARRIHPGASPTDRLDAHATAVLRAAAQEAGSPHDGPDAP